MPRPRHNMMMNLDARILAFVLIGPNNHHQRQHREELLMRLAANKAPDSIMTSHRSRRRAQRSSSDGAERYAN